MNKETNQAYLIPFSHLDLYWAGEELDCLSRGNRIIARAIKLCQQMPDYRFLIEDVVFVDYFLRNHPEMRDELKALVHAGQIEVGPKWAGIHQSLQLGEDLIRNSLYGMAYTRELLDYQSETIHLGDLPSWTPQYPQIAHQLGLRYIISTRCGPKSVPLFHWEALDGSTILTWYAIRGYHWAWSRDFEQVADPAGKLGNEVAEIASMTDAPIMVHWGIDLVLPPEELVQRVNEWNAKADIPMKIATPAEYFKVAETTRDIPSLKGEAPSLWPYLESNYSRMVPLDIPAMSGLVQAEMFTTITSFLGLRTYPMDEFARSWKLLLQGMDHNYPATGAEDTRIRKTAYRTQAIEYGQWTTEQSLRLIAERVDIPDIPGANRREVVPIVVFNPMAWNRKDVASAHVTYHGDIHAMEVGRYRKIRVVNDVGETIPFQQVDIREGVCREETLLFNADIPSLGYRTYYIVPEGTNRGTGFGPNLNDSGATPQAHPPVVTQQGEKFISDHFELGVDRLTGEVTIKDNEGNAVINRARLVAVEEFQKNMGFRDDLTGRVFENRIDSVTLEENGPVRAKIVIQGRILESTVTQEIVLYKDLERVDLTNHIDWQDVHPLRVQQLFPTELEDHQIEYGVPFGASKLDGRLPDSGPSNPDELPEASWEKLRECTYWLDVSSPQNGRGVLIGSDRRAFDVSSPTIKCNLLRFGQSNFEVHIKENELQRSWRGQVGESTSRFTIVPHAGDWRSRHLHRAGWELNNPLVSVAINDPESTKRFPTSHSFLEELGGPYVVSALKQAEDGNGYVLRFFDAEGHGGTTQLTFDWSLGDRFNKQTAQRCTFEWVDFHEQRDESARDCDLGDIQVRPFEIKTVRMGTSAT